MESNFALLSALAAHRLSHGDCQRMEKRVEIGVPFSQQILRRSQLRVSEDLTGATTLPSFVHHFRRCHTCGNVTPPCLTIWCASWAPTFRHNAARCATTV